MTVFWDVAPCSLVEVYRRFRGACCLHHQGNEYTAQHPRRQSVFTETNIQTAYMQILQSRVHLIFHRKERLYPRLFLSSKRTMLKYYRVWRVVKVHRVASRLFARLNTNTGLPAACLPAACLPGRTQTSGWFICNSEDMIHSLVTCACLEDSVKHTDLNVSSCRNLCTDRKVVAHSRLQSVQTSNTRPNCIKVSTAPSSRQ
jgi:hypothetical protein